MEHALATKDNIIYTMKAMGTLRVDQLMKYFRSADDAQKVAFYITELIDSHILTYDKGTNEVTFRDSLRLNRDPVIRRIMAFWILAYMGYDKIQELYSLRYPSQVLYVTETNESYDISVCVTADEGAFAECARQLYLIPGAPDNVNHIAVVPDHEVGKKVLEYNFDSYCIFDEDKVPHYYSL